MEDKLNQEELLQKKIDRYADMLYKIALVQTKNICDAQDIVQEVFYQYMKRNILFESEEHEKAWLIKVTLNYCRRVFRLAFHKHTVQMPSEEYVSGEEGVEEEYIRKEKQKEVLEAVLALPARYRDVLHLFYFEDFSIKEISRILKRKESTVTSQLTRGRELLKKKIKEEYRYE